MIAQLSRIYIKTKPTKAISRLISFIFFEGKPLTTKGQFINPVILFFFKLITLFPIIKRIKQPIFIIGMGRSGTTVLGQILSIHKDLGFLNEPKAMWYYSNPLDDLIGSYSDKNANYIMNDTNATESISKKIHKLYAFYLTTIFSNRVLDKYPEMIFRVPYIHKLFPDAKFIFIYRNGFEASLSSSSWSEKNIQIKKSDETHNWWGKNNRKWKLLASQVVPQDLELKLIANDIAPLTSHIDKSMTEWICTMNYSLHLQSTNEYEILPIAYESLVNEPQDTLQQIFSYCHLGKDQKVIDFANEVLVETPRKSIPPVNPLIKRAFENTMRKFNYSIQ